MPVLRGEVNDVVIVPQEQCALATWKCDELMQVDILRNKGSIDLTNSAACVSSRTSSSSPRNSSSFWLFEECQKKWEEEESKAEEVEANREQYWRKIEELAEGAR